MVVTYPSDAEAELNALLTRVQAEFSAASFQVALKPILDDTSPELDRYWSDPQCLAVLALEHLSPDVRVVLTVRPSEVVPAKKTETWTVNSETSDEVRALVIEVVERLRLAQEVFGLKRQNGATGATNDSALQGADPDSNWPERGMVGLSFGLGWTPSSTLGLGPRLVAQVNAARSWALGLTLNGPQWGASLNADTSMARVRQAALTLDLVYNLNIEAAHHLGLRASFGGLHAELEGQSTLPDVRGRRASAQSLLLGLGLEWRYTFGSLGGLVLDTRLFWATEMREITLGGEPVGRLARPWVSPALGWFVVW